MKLPAIISRIFASRSKELAVVDDRNGGLGRGGGGWFRILEPFTGAWQRNVEVSRESTLAHSAVFACVSLISSDVGKLRPKIMQRLTNRTWTEAMDSPYSGLLQKPNDYQNRSEFFAYWIISKLIHGNTYTLKERDSRGVATTMHILDPRRVGVLIANDGTVFYRLRADRLSGVDEEIVIPAREIIHDKGPCLFHKLVGVSPLFAAGLAAQQGVNIQQNSAAFFANMSQPGGILTAPGHIEDDTADRLKRTWEEKFSGGNLGRTVVLGDGVEWKPLVLTAEDSQLIEQLKWTAETVASVFRVPPFMIGVGQMPAYNNIAQLTQQYYSQCLQSLIESLELCLDDGLGLSSASNPELAIEFDLDALLRMDTATRFKAYHDAITAGWMAPNEARQREDLPPVEGGDTPYLQQQNWALSQLAKRGSAPS